MFGKDCLLSRREAERFMVCAQPQPSSGMKMGSLPAVCPFVSCNSALQPRAATLRQTRGKACESAPFRRNTALHCDRETQSEPRLGRETTARWCQLQALAKGICLCRDWILFCCSCWPSTSPEESSGWRMRHFALQETWWNRSLDG